MKNWKRPGLLTFLFLVLMILIIPAVIVIPFIDSGNEQRITEQHPKETTPMIEVPDDLSPFSIDVLRTNTNQVEEVPLEKYVARVVASEMPANFEKEALKAQALAARTYIVQHYSNGENISEQADVTDTVDHQVYKNDSELRKQWKGEYTANMSKINQAVKDTAGEIITYEEKPIFAAFFSTSNGYTENSEDYWKNAFPYLKSVESPWDKQSPKFLDQKVLSVQEVEAKLGVTFPADVTASRINLTEGNRVSSIEVGGKKFSGREIREKLGLRSSDFSIDQKDGHLIFTTKGYGHGVGMSQYGANGMAKQGSDYKEIVQHYYQGAKVTEMEQLNSLQAMINPNE
ncbi:stage II sporulation protein D [Thalassobacillus cyri]|uniref:Stage II sporulation protein D n=1 Tax=Thalassobacillus cyri TaxID=571932 RepID=A0A1H4D897_9BACI|nr:stage II sporulation protein D [Thalassobacillus cyri]SEA68798.1 stage II sporulation protein D [Thalassobacillus cyri]